MSQQLNLKMQIAEARGEIPAGSAAQLTFASVAEAGLRSFAKGYYGAPVFNEAMDSAVRNRQSFAARPFQGNGEINDTFAEAMTEDIAEGYLADIKQLTSAYGATHTTSDFPLALANLRQRTLRAALPGVDSNWRDFATVTTTPDFKTIRTLSFNELPELRQRPEGTDVQYASFGESGGGYRVANYERAIKYTWEMSVNDEVGKFVRALESLGRGARRTEAFVVFQAIAAGLPRTAIAGTTAGVPTVDRVRAMRNALATRTFTDSDGALVEYGYNATDLIYGTADQDSVATILTQEYTDFQGGTRNILFGAFTPHLERLWSRVLGRDYVVYDNMFEWLEVAFLEGFQTGPKTYTKIPDVREYPDEGSFADHTLHVKIGHSLGAKVIDATAALRFEGAAA